MVRLNLNAQGNRNIANNIRAPSLFSKSESAHFNHSLFVFLWETSYVSVSGIVLQTGCRKTGMKPLECISIWFLHCEGPIAQISHVPVLCPQGHVSSGGKLLILPQDLLQQLRGVDGDRLESAFVYGPVQLLLIELMGLGGKSEKPKINI